jgi:ectoine hydroxylase-related dioxygenase (phytanoyl-CoA dioxygenase family)
MTEHAWPDDTDLESYRQAGYVVVRNALPPGEVAHYLAVLDRLTTRIQADEQLAARHREGDHSVRVRNAVGLEPALAPLLDHPATFPLLLETIGPYLRLVGSEAFVRQPAPAPMLHFHTDGGPAMQMVSVDHSARALQVKIQFFLTDVSEEDNGNFTLVRGSHRRLPSETRYGCFVPEANALLEQGAMPDGAIQLRARPGDAVVFPYSLWHAVASNRGGRVRKSLILRYGHLWHQPFDYAVVDSAHLDGMTERQRRLLGDLGPDAGPRSWYKPPHQLEIMTGAGAHSPSR